MLNSSSSSSASRSTQEPVVREPRRVGRRVFPNGESDKIRQSEKLLHYVPPPEPPVDYTIRAKQEKDYRVVTNVFERPSSTDYTKEEQHLRSPSVPRLRDRRNTVDEVLDELDTVLFEASIPFDELRKTVENFNLTFKPFAPDTNIDELPEIPYSKIPKRIPKLESTKRVEKSIQMDDRTKTQIDEMYKKTVEKIDAAKAFFTPQYFNEQYQREGIPYWKRNLLAEKKSKETIRKVEHDAWVDFERAKNKLKPIKKEQMKRSSSVQIASSRRKTLG